MYEYLIYECGSYLILFSAQITVISSSYDAIICFLFINENVT